MAFSSTFELSQLNGTNGFVINGIDEYDFSGNSVSGAGDINGDGFDDIIIGAPFADPNGERDAGESYVVFGASSGFSPSLNPSTLNGTNGFVINGIDEGDSSGRSVSGAGDINGDGIDDIIIGASYAAPNGRGDAGESYVVFGSSGGFAPSLNLSSLNGTNGFVINGINRNNYSGRSVSGAGDINGDGINDIIIGADGASPNGRGYAGESYVVFGASSGFSPSLNLSTLNGTNGFVINGIDERDRSGMSVSSAGDINGDGFDDIIIGASNADPNGERYAGESYVVFGASSGFSPSLNLSTLNGTNGFVINGIDAVDLSGRSVSGAGDINGDGFDDIIIGAFRADSNGERYAGESYVVFGASSGFSPSLNLSSLNGTNGFVINGIDGGDRSGRSVSGAGDINGDGFDDIIIGASSADPNGKDYAGESYVVFGASSGFSPSLNLSTLNGTNGFVINGIDELDESGYSVSGAGDINGDGFDDIIIGADGADPNGERFAGESYVVFGQRSDGMSNDRIRGTASDDLLIGDRLDNTILGLAGNDTLRGRQGDDNLIGGGGNDLIVGGAGGDRLTGGNGFDTLKGGAGEDEFVFKNVRHKADRILDFDVTEDVILIRKSGFDLDLGKGNLGNGRFTIGSGASDRGDRFIYNDQTGALIFDADGTGAESGKAIAFLNPGDTLRASNIRIV